MHRDWSRVLDVKVICHHNLYGIEIHITSTSGDNTEVWVLISRSSNRYVDELRYGDSENLPEDVAHDCMQDQDQEHFQVQRSGDRILVRRDTDDVRWKTLNEGEKEKCWKVVETACKGVVGFKPVTIISPEEASKILHPKQPRVILPDSSCTGRKHTADIFQKHDGECMNSKTPTSTRSSAVAHSINILMQVLASTQSAGTLADDEETFMQGYPSVR